MKIVLALPPFDISQSYGKGGALKRGVLPPLGVGYLAASAEMHGHSAALVDATLLNLDTRSTAEAILAEKPDLIGLSTVTKQANVAYALAALLKSMAPGIPIVMGGPHATSFSDSILDECASIDYLVPGEGELPFTELLQRLDERKPVDSVVGILYRGADGKVVATPPSEPVRDLDTLPHPARHIYKMRQYIPLPNQCRRSPATTAISSRGCPYGRCTFCYQGGRYGYGYRRRSPEHVIDEIGRLARDWGIREIIFWDDNFCVNSKWINAFCDLLDKNRLDITWTVQGRVDTVTEDMLRRMAASGCYNIYYGLESGSQKMLDFIWKGITLEQSRAAVKWANDAGMEIRASFILGMPTETKEMAEETIRFACGLDVDWMIFFPYLVKSGTPLSDLAAQEGIVLGESVDVHAPTFIPKGYANAEEVAALIRSAYRRYYLRPRYMARALWRARKPVVLKNYWDAFRYWLSLTRET